MNRKIRERMGTGHRAQGGTFSHPHKVGHTREPIDLGNKRVNSANSPTRALTRPWNELTDWWTLSEGDIFSTGSASQPLPEHRKVDVRAWIEEASRHSPELPGNSTAASNSAEVE